MILEEKEETGYNFILEEKSDKKNILLKIITFFPGIRYKDLSRVAKLTNGTLSHHLTTLEKNSSIKVLRTENSNITRYYHASIPSDETILRGYLKIKTTKQIIALLYNKKFCTFNEIVLHINKAPSTTSWHLKRLFEAEVIIRTKRNDISEYSLKNRKLIEKLFETAINTLVDRSIDNYSTLIEDL
jgi:predicted transcriptional regulator